MEWLILGKCGICSGSLMADGGNGWGCRRVVCMNCGADNLRRAPTAAEKKAAAAGIGTLALKWGILEAEALADLAAIEAGATLAELSRDSKSWERRRSALLNGGNGQAPAELPAWLVAPADELDDPMFGEQLGFTLKTAV